MASLARISQASFLVRRGVLPAQRRWASTQKLTLKDAAQVGQVQDVEREDMPSHVVIVGAGPSGLSAAIRLKQLAQEKDQEIEVTVVEKGAHVGAHIVSGACVEPRALDELLPDWRDSAPLKTEVTTDSIHLLTEKSSQKLICPPSQQNHGNYVGSLGQLCAWLGEQAEELGVTIFPGFSAKDISFDEEGRVNGVILKDEGVNKKGEATDQLSPGYILYSNQLILAEGARGNLSRLLWDKFDLRKDCDIPTYALGIKEVWEIPKEKHQPGKVMHTVGWPLDTSTYGGSWMYHYGENLVSLGLVVGLDYVNPWISPFKEMQRMKHHPMFKDTLEGGTCISYGARTLWEGGLNSMAKMTFPGGLIVGDDAGTINIAKIKGTHTAMKSGMLAAEAIFEHAVGTEELREQQGIEVTQYADNFKKSWLFKELYAVRNYRQSFAKWGLWGGLAYSGISEYILKGKEPWHFKHPHSDYTSCKPAAESKKIEYPAPDGKISFDLLTSVARANANFNADQPAHLVVIDKEASDASFQKWAGTETRFCPAGVYERQDDEETGEKNKLIINAQNCIFCKACDCKVGDWIGWTVPEGGSGPQWTNM